ncbi:MAG: glycosyltransferase family 2 protein [Pseudomonadota bacterium]
MPLCVLIPALNEAEQLPRTLAGLARALPGVPVLVVENGCTDGTPALARRFGARVVSQPGRGYAATLGAGFRAALGGGFRRALLLDADGQHPPESAPALLAALEEADLCTGSRAGTASPGTLPRRAGNALLAAVVRAGSGAPLRDVMSGFWALGPRALELFATCFPLPGGAADANVRVFALRHGLRVVERPVFMPVRTGGDSMHSGLPGARNFAVSALSLALVLRDRTPGAAPRG